MPTAESEVEQFAAANREYKYGFVSDIESDDAPPGLNEDIVRFISAKKDEPQWLLDFRLKSFRHWLTLEEPHHWGKIGYPPVDYQQTIYYSAPKAKYKSLDEVDPELLAVYDKLGVPVHERKALLGVEEEPNLVPSEGPTVAVDAVFDSVSVATTFKKKLAEQGVIFCSFSEAVKEHPELVKQYMGSVVPYSDNYYATLNSAVFTDGSFVYIPKGVKCPMELSTYFRINAKNTGQFERTLIIAEEGASVSYLEGCTAPQRDENQLHAAVVELVAHADATIKYSTVQNWYPGDPETGKGGIYNFVTKRGKCQGDRSKITWTQVETGSAITWKYPGCILIGDDTVGEFYSVAVTNGRQQADTGTKMIHIGKNTRSARSSARAFQRRPRPEHLPRAGEGARQGRERPELHAVRLDADRQRLRRPHRAVHRRPQPVGPRRARGELRRKIGEEQLFYCKSRGIEVDDAVNMIVNGFCKEVFAELPMEFAVEAKKLLEVSLEGSVG